jgi:hypothetical protein
MRSLFIALVLFTGIYSCQDEKSNKQEEIKEEIKKQEQTVSRLSEQQLIPESIESAKAELIAVLLKYYRSFPEDEYAASCLSKVHMTYSGLGDVKKAVAYADTLIEKYPDFADRKQIIESQIVSYEMMIQPRDKEKISEYLNLWLKENKDAPKDKVQAMKEHLENIDEPLIQRIQLQKGE